MKVKTFFKCMMLAGIIPFSSIMVANDDTPKEEQVIALTNNKDYGSNDQTLQVPVNATVNNSVLNVQFTGTVPHATVRVNNALTGGTISQQSMAGLSMGTYTVSVTNNVNGQSVSGNFNVE